MKQIKNKMILALIMSLPMQGLLQAELLKIRQIETKNIEYNAKQVRQLLFKHRAAKIGLLTVSGVANLIEIYRFFQFFYNKFSSSSSPGPSIKKEATNNQPDQEIKKSHLFGRTIMSIKSLISSKEFWYAALFGSSAITTQKLMPVVDHPHTMTWFRYKKVPYKETFKQAHEYAQLLAQNTIDKEKGIYYKQTVHNLCDQLIKQMEQLFGFMSYKGTQLKGSERGKIKKIIRYLSHCTNDWAAAINTLFEEDPFDPQQFTKLITDYEEELNRELNNFSRVEGETSSDQLQVVRMHIDNS